jgi:hypothetical protein
MGEAGEEGEANARVDGGKEDEEGRKWTRGRTEGEGEQNEQGASQEVEGGQALHRWEDSREGNREKG